MNIKPAPHPLKAKFKSAGLTQADVSKFCSTTPNWMNLILNGYQKPPEHVQQCFAQLEALMKEEQNTE